MESCSPTQHQERRVAQLGERFFLQPKLNGERCWVEWFNRETPMLISSYGNELNLPHITAALIQQNPSKASALMGELYIHGELGNNTLNCFMSWKECMEELMRCNSISSDFKMPAHSTNDLFFCGTKPFDPTSFRRYQITCRRRLRDPLQEYTDNDMKESFSEATAQNTQKNAPLSSSNTNPPRKINYRIPDVVEGEGVKECLALLSSEISNDRQAD